MHHNVVHHGRWQKIAAIHPKKIDVAKSQCKSHDCTNTRIRVDGPCCFDHKIDQICLAESYRSSVKYV